MMQHIRQITAASAVTAALAITGCASSGEKPVRQFAKAEATIEQAVQQGAAQHSRTIIKRAERKLEQAREESEAGNNVRAERLAQEAEVDASYAIASAETEKLRDIAVTLRENLQALEKQAQSSTSRGGVQ